MDKGLQYVIGAIVVIIILAVIAVGLSHNGATGSTSSGTSTTAGTGNGTPSSSGMSAPILLTDPPVVPTGTSALTITYTSVQVQTSGGAGSGWINATGSGTINLMSLLNTSQVIGMANLSANSSVEQIRFNVSSATITVNGTTSNVTLPNRMITAHISGETHAAANSGVLLDLSPTVATIFTANSTVFVLVPSVRAVVVGNQTVHASSDVGARENLSVRERSDLKNVRPNISIMSASLTVNGNVTDLSVAVKDNSNTSVSLKHILLFGNTSVYVTPVIGVNGTVHVGGHDDGIGANVSANASVDTAGSVNGKINASEHSGSHDGASASESGSANALSVGEDVTELRVFNFVVNANSTALTLPSLSTEAEAQGNGYNLSAGSTATFTFNNTISVGEGHITIAPVAGSMYDLVVRGEEGATASANVTAS